MVRIAAPACFFGLHNGAFFLGFPIVRFARLASFLFPDTAKRPISPLAHCGSTSKSEPRRQSMGQERSPTLLQVARPMAGHLGSPSRSKEKNNRTALPLPGERGLAPTANAMYAQRPAIARPGHPRAHASAAAKVLRWRDDTPYSEASFRLGPNCAKYFQT